MKQPNKDRTANSLRRLFDASVIKEFVYFETAVLVQPKSLQPVGYFVFLVCNNALYVVEMDESKPKAPTYVPFDHIDNVEKLQDSARFLEESIANDSQHIRVSIDDQLGLQDVIDFYTFFNDSHLFFYLRWSLLDRRMKKAWPMLHENSLCRDVFALNQFQSNRVFDTLKKGILSAQTELGKVDSLAELSVAIADNNFIKRDALNCEPLLQFIVSELRSLSYLRQFGLFVETVDDIDEDKVPIRSVKLFAALLLLLKQILSGGVAINERVLILKQSTFSFEDLVEGILCTANMSDEEVDNLDNRRIRRTEIDGGKETSMELVPTQKKIGRTIKQMVIKTNEQTHVHDPQAQSAVRVSMQELDMLQASVLFHLFSVLEHSHTLFNSTGVDTQLLFRLLLESEPFVKSRAPRFFFRLVQLLRLQLLQSHSLALLYQHCFILQRCCARSNRLREMVSVRNHAELSLLRSDYDPRKHLLSTSLSTGSSAAFFRKLAIAELEDLLTDIEH